MKAGLGSNELRAALRDADWEELLIDLVDYARRCLRRAGWPEGRDEEPSASSAADLVQRAVERALDGTRIWEPNTVDLPGFLRGIVRSVVSAERKRYIRGKVLTSTATVAAYAGVVPSAEDEVICAEGRRELHARFESCIADDPDLQALYTAIFEGGVTKREELAKLLGWKAARVSVKHKKLQRRLNSLDPATYEAGRDDEQRRTS